MNQMPDYKKFYDNLEPHLIKMVDRATTKIENGQYGNVSHFAGISEYKIDFGVGYRIYFYTDDAGTKYLLVGGTKKTQKRDVELAIAYMERLKIPVV